MDYYKIGQLIRKYRRIKGFSQEELSEQVGISVTHMSHIETGNTKLSLPVFIDIANALDVRTDELLTESKLHRKYASDELNAILERCTSEQLLIVTDIVRAAKAALDKYDGSRKIM